MAAGKTCFAALVDSDNEEDEESSGRGSDKDGGNLVTFRSVSSKHQQQDDVDSDDDDNEKEVDEREKDRQAVDDTAGLACNGAKVAANNMCLVGTKLAVHRHNLGICVGSVCSANFSGDMSVKKAVAAVEEAVYSFPILSIAALESCGVPAGLISACGRCAAGSPHPTGMQSECWGLLLAQRPAADTPRSDAPLTDADVMNLTVNTCCVREETDIVGLGPTGSGKTLAYLLPLLADGLCAAPCSPPPKLPDVLQDFRQLFPKSFPTQGGSSTNAAMLQRIEKLMATNAQTGLAALRQVAQKASVNQDKSLISSWQQLLDSFDNLGLLRPSAMVLAPTRELAHQTGQVAASLGAASCVVLGGVDDKQQQERLLIQRPSLVVGTPGCLRLLCGQRPASAGERHLASKLRGKLEPEQDTQLNDDDDVLPRQLLSLSSVARLVLDGGDKLLDQGFEHDILALSALALRRKLTLIFADTWTSREKALENILRPGAICVAVPSIPSNVTLQFELVAKAKRFDKLKSLLFSFGISAKVLVFALCETEVQDLTKQLREFGVFSWALEDHMSQSSRNVAMQAFREASKTDAAVLVTTDDAARGFDIPEITHVVNYALGLAIDSYVHRVGRCGQCGRSGTAVTFITDCDKRLSPIFVRMLEGAQQTVPALLRAMADDFEKRSAVRIPSTNVKPVVKKGKGGGKGNGREKKELQPQSKNADTRDGKNLKVHNGFNDGKSCHAREKNLKRH